jgi:adenylate kinase
MPLVLVTGASGYIAGHIIHLLLRRDFRVRGTVRSLAREESYAHLKALPGAEERLTLVECDLTSDDGWQAAVVDADFVLHTASPFPAERPDHEDELIKPAVEGTQRVLQAIAEHAPTVKRVVLTSSIASVMHSPNDGKTPFGEQDWSDVDRCDPYSKSKTLAERAAWDFVEKLAKERSEADAKQPHVFELTTVNPAFVQGPLLCTKGATSYEALKRLLNATDPGVMEVPFNVVDVRDVAEAHVNAMTTDDVNGRRFIVDGGFITYGEIARIIAGEFNPQGYSVPTRKLPYCLVKMIAMCDKTVRLAVKSLGSENHFDTKPAQDVLGIRFRPIRQTLIEMGYSMIDLEVVRNRLGDDVDPHARAVATGLCNDDRGAVAPKHLIIAGPPAGGKGTQCELIAKKYGVVHISTGDVLRAAVSRGSDVGVEAKQYMDEGKLVPDEVIVQLVLDRIAQPDCVKHGFLLDGFPRSKVQAEALAENKVNIDRFVLMDVPDDILIERVDGRRLDPETSKIYHLVLSPPENDEIAARLIQRDDDTAEKIKIRIATYKENLAGVTGIFEDCVRNIDGNQAKDKVFEQCCKAIEE